MTINNIPISGAELDGAFYFVVSFDGVDYRLDFQYNDREGFWYFDLADPAGTQIKSGIKVVVNWPFFRQLVGASRPAGELLAIDARTSPNEPGLDDLGVRALLTYVEEASLP